MTRAADIDISPDTTGGTATEVLAAFDRYERALVAGDVATMTELFLDSPQTLRFGIGDQQVGSVELAAWRAAQPAPPPGRRLFQTRTVVLCRDAAVVTTLFDYPSGSRTGRQSQTWWRTGAGWRIVHAHVSEIPVTG